MDIENKNEEENLNKLFIENKNYKKAKCKPHYYSKEKLKAYCQVYFQENKQDILDKRKAKFYHCNVCDKTVKYQAQFAHKKSRTHLQNLEKVQNYPDK